MTGVVQKIDRKKGGTSFIKKKKNKNTGHKNLALKQKICLIGIRITNNKKTVVVKISNIVTVIDMLILTLLTLIEMHCLVSFETVNFFSAEFVMLFGIFLRLIL